jgi:hypothetical protein
MKAKQRQNPGHERIASPRSLRALSERELSAVTAGLNPQPEPPGINPQPYPPGLNPQPEPPG